MYQSCSDTWSTLISLLQTYSILATSLPLPPLPSSSLLSFPVLSAFLAFPQAASLPSFFCSWCRRSELCLNCGHRCRVRWLLQNCKHYDQLIMSIIKQINLTIACFKLSLTWIQQRHKLASFRRNRCPKFSPYRSNFWAYFWAVIFRWHLVK